jgi:predicted ribonuclease YlaK
MLRHALPSDEIDRLVLSRRYWAIHAAPDSSSFRAVDTEIDDRLAALSNAVEWVDETKRKWSQSPGKLVVADTSVFCQHPNKLADLDLAGILRCREVPVRLMMPVLVLDELEGLKQSSKQQTRWRAAHTLGRLDEVLGSDGSGLLNRADFSALDTGGIPRGEVYVEVYFDPAGHHRLPINDDELVDRALAIQTEAGRDVTFITYDTAQSTRARFAGLRVVKLPTDPGPEPT